MKCPLCNEGNVIIRYGKYGFFGACDTFPKCKQTIKLQDIIYKILEKDGIELYAWNHECWKCHKETKVYTYFINKQIKPYMEEHTELGNLGLGTISSIDQYLIKKYDTINNNFSKTRNEYVASNNCSYCNALIGNHYIVDDPHDIFHDWASGNLKKYKVDTIPFNVLNITKDEFLGLEDFLVQVF